MKVTRHIPLSYKVCLDFGYEKNSMKVVRYQYFCCLKIKSGTIKWGYYTNGRTFEETVDDCPPKYFFQQNGHAKLDSKIKCNLSATI